TKAGTPSVDSPRHSPGFKNGSTVHGIQAGGAVYRRNCTPTMRILRHTTLQASLLSIRTGVRVACTPCTNQCLRMPDTALVLQNRLNRSALLVLLAAWRRLSRVYI